MLLKDKPSRFFAILTLFVLMTSICFYLLVKPDANGQAQVLVQPPSQPLPQSFISQPLTESGITGGRARGGTFQAPTAPAPSRPGYSNDGFSRSYRPSYPRFDYPGAGPVIIPMPVPNPNYAPYPVDTVPSDDELDIGLIFLLMVLGFVVLPIVVNYLRFSASGAEPAGMGVGGDRRSERVTVTQLQIALVAQARELQQALESLTVRANLSTQAGLARLLQETVLALLRSPHYWTHIRASSQTLKSREAASRVFEQLSIEERSKFKSETLVNISGEVRRQTVSLSEDRDPEAYLVVTLLVGTTDDRPLFERVQSASDLSAALQRLGAISPEELLVYELLWTPQAENDTLSREELLTQYPGLVSL